METSSDQITDMIHLFLLLQQDSNKRLSYSMDDLLDVGERGGEGGGRRVTFSSTDNLVISPSPEHDMKQSPPPPQQQPQMWGAQGMWVRGGKPYSRSTLEINLSPLLS